MVWLLIDKFLFGACRILKIFKVSGLHTLIRTSVPKQQKEREGENHNA